jgi:hypothetical protein
MEIQCFSTLLRGACLSIEVIDAMQPCRRGVLNVGRIGRTLEGRVVIALGTSLFVGKSATVAQVGVGLAQPSGVAVLAASLAQRRLVRLSGCKQLVGLGAARVYLGPRRGTRSPDRRRRRGQRLRRHVRPSAGHVEIGAGHLMEPTEGVLPRLR